MYRVVFPNAARKKEFKKKLLKLPLAMQNAVMEAVEALAKEPRPSGTPKITPPVSVGEDFAQYRIRIGDYRVLYDVHDKSKTVWILSLRRRGEKTYK